MQRERLSERDAKSVCDSLSTDYNKDEIGEGANAPYELKIIGNTTASGIQGTNP